jgi:hypothetical protein
MHQKKKKEQEEEGKKKEDDCSILKYMIKQEKLNGGSRS